jgi:hypothetical protein
MAEWVAIDEAKKSKWLVIIDYEVYIMDHACCTSIHIMLFSQSAQLSVNQCWNMLFIDILENWVVYRSILLYRSAFPVTPDKCDGVCVAWYLWFVWDALQVFTKFVLETSLFAMFSFCFQCNPLSYYSINIKCQHCKHCFVVLKL